MIDSADISHLHPVMCSGVKSVHSLSATLRIADQPGSPSSSAQPVGLQQGLGTTDASAQPLHSQLAVLAEDLRELVSFLGRELGGTRRQHGEILLVDVMRW